MMRKKIFVTLFMAICVLLGGIVMAGDDIEQHRPCAQCGMDRKAYGFSRMLIVYEDGTVAGVCSLHCASNELSRNQDRTIKLVQVADRNTRSLIDARQAYWVMGGAKRGVMTRVPKWAFGARPDAEAFIKEYGGRMVTWDEALAAAREER